MSGIEGFIDKDPGYLDWLARHPGGFVINAGRTPSAACLMLDRAGCGAVSGAPARGTTSTGDYVKAVVSLPPCGGHPTCQAVPGGGSPDGTATPAVLAGVQG